MGILINQAILGVDLWLQGHESCAGLVHGAICSLQCPARILGDRERNSFGFCQRAMMPLRSGEA